MLVKCNFKPPTLVIEVFKTTVTNTLEARIMVRKLLRFMPQHRINFDLEDEDNILRVAGFNVIPEHVIAVLEEHGYKCIALE